MMGFRSWVLSLLVLPFIYASPLIINTEPEPSSIVDGCVSAISGNFVRSKTDIVVQGVEPIMVIRSFGGMIQHRLGGKFEPAGGWQWFGYTHAIFAEGVLHISEPNGTALSFRPNHPGYKQHSTEFDLDGECLKGYCNTSRGYPSARHDVTNYSVMSFGQFDCFMLKCADGTKRFYKSLGKDSHCNRHFLLEKQQLPNGNWVIYEYRFELKKSKESLARALRYPHTRGLAKVWTTNPSRSQVYAWLCIDYTSERDTVRNFKVITSDQKTVNYEFKSLKSLDESFWKKVGKPTCYLLTKVHGPSVKDEAIRYHLDKKHADPLVASVHHPEGRIKMATYFRDQGTYVKFPSGKEQHIENYKHDAFQRVKELVVLVNGQYAQTHRFFHEPENGRCWVYDAEGHYRIFHYNPSQRIKQIEYFSKKNELQRVDVLRWDGHRLKQRQVLDDKQKAVSSREYEYDCRGNVIKESVLGQITGFSRVDTTVIQRKFVNDLLVEEVSSSGPKTTYRYLPCTDLRIEKFLWDGDKIIKRYFWVYDEDHLLIREIQDDGSSQTQDDLTGVTIRKVRAIGKNKNKNFYGMPETITYFNSCKVLKREKLYYDKHGNIQYREVFDAGNKFRYRLERSFDDRGNLKKKVNALGQVTKHDYDPNNNLVFKKDVGGLETRYVYDTLDRLSSKSQKIPEGDERVFKYDYNNLNQLTTTWDQFGNPTAYQYDSLGNCIQDNLLDQKVTKRRFDAFGNVVSATDADGHTIKTTYNIFNQPLTVTYADSTQEHFKYDLAGKLVEKTNQCGITTRYERDVLGRWIRKSTAEADAIETKTYNGFECTAHTDAEGYLTTYEYDRAGRLVGKTREGRRTAYAYDALGRQSQITVGDTVYKTEYDLLDRPVVKSTLGLDDTLYRIEKYKCDKYGNCSQIIRHIDGKDAVEKLTYDGFGRLRSHTDALGYITKIQYSEKEVLVKTKMDPNGTKVKSTYNPLGQMVLQQRLGSEELSRTEYSYSLHGDLLEKTQTVYPSKKKIKTSWTYDAMHRPLTLNEADLRITQTSYNPNGLKSQITKPDGTMLSYSYDALDHLATLSSSDGSIDYTYSHDKLGNLITCRDNVKNTATTRSYDAFGNLAYETLANGLTLSSKYNSNGRKIALTYPDGSSAHYTYESPNLAKVTYKDQVCSYAYDLGGNVTSNGSSDLSYDSVGRLKQVQSSDHAYSIDAFDPLGNVLKASTTFEESSTKTYAYDQLNQLMSDNGSSFTFDSNYNRLSDNNGSYEVDDLNQIIGLSYDQNGNLLEYNGQAYVYDALDRLVSVTENGVTHTYIYDGLHRRIFADGIAFYYDDKNEIGSTNQEKRVLANAKTAEIGSTAFIELDDTVFTPLHDAHGNIIAIKNTAKLETYSYDAFGVHNPSQNPWRYQSKRTDPTNLVNFGRRYYIPKLGRWLTTDPVGYTDSDNLYQYALNNPLSHFDPYGESLGGFLLGIGEMCVGAGIVASAFALEIVTVGGYTVGFTLQAGAGIALMSHGASLASANADDLSTRSTNKTYNGYDPYAAEYLRKQAKRNTNPFEGPVSEDVMVVDEDGNVIPVGEGNWATGSQDGKWIQEMQPGGGPKGEPTGLRKDGGGHSAPKHTDPRAIDPHGHVPGVTNSDGTPWLPIRYMHVERGLL